MGRSAFVFLIVTLALCFATVDSHSQEVEKELPTVPSIGAAGSDMDSTDLTDIKSSETTPATPSVSKKKLSLMEEFFSSPLNYFLVLIVGFYVYFMFVQPRGARQEKKLQLERLGNLKKNDRVVTTAGIHGIVSNINTDAGTITLRVDENSNAKLTIDRNSIRSVAS